MGAVQRDPVVLQPIELLGRELEVDARPGAVVDDEEIGGRELRPGDRVDGCVHRAGDAAHRLGGPEHEPVRGLFVEFVGLELSVEERDDVVERHAHFTRSEISRLSTAVFARPPIFFMTGPMRAEIARWLPARMSATALGFAAIAASTAAAMAASSEIWERPFSLTIASASRPVASISAKTVLAAVVLTVPASMRPTRAPSCAGVSFSDPSATPAARRCPSSSPVTQFATRFACAGAVPAAASNQSARARSETSTRAS